jgi:7,8-dihydroneopterin aldolase/epimerase/oxygenase
MDIIYLSQLKLNTLIGIYEWERQAKRVIFVDLELATDTRAAAATDQLANTLDYGALAQRLTKVAENSEFFLIETLAERLANLILQEFHVPWLRLKLSKRGAVPTADDVGLIIERGCLPSTLET